MEYLGKNYTDTGYLGGKLSGYGIFKKTELVLERYKAQKLTGYRIIFRPKINGIRDT